MECIDGGYTWWKKAIVGTALVAAGAGLIAALAYGQIWLASTILRVTFMGAVQAIGASAVLGIIGLDSLISIGIIGSAMKWAGLF